jgi:hypothetical protein
MRIRAKCRTRILQLGITCILFATSLLAQKETFAPANDVSFTVSAERRSYKVGEQITLNYRIANISNAPLYVPREREVKCPAFPHVSAWFENRSGKHFIPGYGGDCWTKINSLTITERMSKEAVLLTPGEHLDGTFRLDTKLFGGLNPGAYRIEAALYGWADEKFTDAEKSELARMPYPFLRGEIPNSVRITLTSNEK